MIAEGDADFRLRRHAAAIKDIFDDYFIIMC